MGPPLPQRAQNAPPGENYFLNALTILFQRPDRKPEARPDRTGSRRPEAGGRKLEAGAGGRKPEARPEAKEEKKKLQRLMIG